MQQDAFHENYGEFMPLSHHISLTSSMNHTYWDWQCLESCNATFASGSCSAAAQTTLQLNKCASSHWPWCCKHVCFTTHLPSTLPNALSLLSNSSFRGMVCFYMTSAVIHSLKKMHFHNSPRTQKHMTVIYLFLSVQSLIFFTYSEKSLRQFQSDIVYSQIISTSHRLCAAI